MSKTLLSGYLWGYDRPNTADVIFRKFREFYKDGSLYFKMDVGGKEKEHKDICEKYGAEFSVQPMKVGRCGFMNHYNEWEEGGSEALQRECWPKENAFTWMDSLYEVAKKCDSKYLISLEDDTFILKPISILEEDFGIAVVEYNCNRIHPSLLELIDSIDGNTDIPINLHGFKGYGAQGGFIINCETFVKGWDKLKPTLEEKWDEIREQTHLIGWVDVLPQLAVMASNGSVVWNRELVQTWFHEKPELYPGKGHWRDYEIVDFLKDDEIINNL